MMYKGTIKLLPFILAVALPAQANWLSNGGFDSWTANSPDSWSVSNGSASAHLPALHALYTLKLEASAASASVAQSCTAVGTEAVLQLWWRTAGTGTTQLTVTGSSSGGLYDSGAVSLSKYWKPVDQSFAVVNGETLTVTITVR